MDRHEIKRKIKDSLTIYDILPSIDRTAKLIRCPLPGHEDKHPSFLISDRGKRGRCQSQCAGLGSLDIIALHQKINGVGYNDTLKALAEKAGIPFPGNGNGHKEPAKRIERTYDYTDASGKLLYQVVRYNPKSFSQRRPDGKGGWIYNLEGIKPVLYRLPEVIKAETVFVAEGEKDVDNLRSLDLTATTNSGGAGKWKPEYPDCLKGKNAIIFFDNHELGRKHGEEVASYLCGIAKSVKLIDLPGLPSKGDVSDWIETRKGEGKDLEAIKVELLALVDSTPEYKPLAQEKPTESPQFDLSFLESWKHIQSLEVHTEWIVDRLIPKDAVNLIFGKGGIGKTWLLLDMARSVGSGLPFLGLQTRKTPVIFVDFENPLAVLNTRLQKLGDAENVYFWRANNERIKAPKLDTPKWDQYKQLPSGAVLIFDTLRASHSGNENASDEIGAVMERLKELRDMGFTVLILHHTAKNSSKVSKGSSAIVDLADHILGLTLVKKKADGTDILLGDDEDMDEEAVYRFGVREKTRFEPYHVYLTLNPDRGFELAPDPQGDTLKAMLDILKVQGALNKTQFLEEAKERLKLSKHKTRKLFEIGTGRYWDIERHTAVNNSQIVTPIIGLSGYSPPIGVGKPENRQAGYPGQSENPKNKSSEPLDNTGLSGYPDLFGKPGKPELREGVI